MTEFLRIIFIIKNKCYLYFSSGFRISLSGFLKICILTGEFIFGILVTFLHKGIITELKVWKSHDFGPRLT